MIDVKMTILETIKDKIKRLRFLGDNNHKTFKKILSLIVLDDLYDWSNYLDAPQHIQKKLQDLRNQYILCQRDFKIQHAPYQDYYVNVNTPQSNDTWKRVWDSEHVIEITEDIPKFSYFSLYELDKVKNGYVYSEEIPDEINNHIPIIEENITNEYITE